MRASGVDQTPKQTYRQQSFCIIRDDNRINLGHSGRDLFPNPPVIFVGKRSGRFLVYTNDLLTVGDHSSFYAGWPIGNTYEPVGRYMNGFKKPREYRPIMVGADGAHQIRRRAEASDIGSNVSRASGGESASLQLDDGYGGFGRDTLYVSPPIAVEHNVTD